MPLFGHFKRFKSPLRKTGASTAVANEDRTKTPQNVKMEMAGSKLLFDPTKGEWAADGDGVLVHNDEMRRLKEENNLLKVKVELLLNILAKMIKDGDHPIPLSSIRSATSHAKQTRGQQPVN